MFQKPVEPNSSVLPRITRADLTMAKKATPEDVLTHKKRKAFTNKENTNKIKRDYLKLQTVTLSIDDLPAGITTTNSKKLILPNIKKSLTTPSGDKIKSKRKSKTLPRENDKEITISKIIVSKDLYRLTINDGGREEDINVSILPTLNNSENYNWEKYLQIASGWNSENENKKEEILSEMIRENNRSSLGIPYNVFENKQVNLKEQTLWNL